MARCRRRPPRRASAPRRAAARRAPTDRPIRTRTGACRNAASRGACPKVTLPGPYNNNLQIVQTPQYVVLMYEMIHDARIVAMDGRPHAPTRRYARGWVIRAATGTATLSSSTPPISPIAPTSADRARACTSSSASRASTPTRSTIASPLTIRRRGRGRGRWLIRWCGADGPIYEFACHEGNYGLHDILTGARYEEKVAGEKK